MNRNELDAALASVRQAQDTVLIQLQTYLRSRSREAAARLDAAIEAERSTVETISGHRHDYLAKQGVNQ
jgi:hypothetical protein